MSKFHVDQAQRSNESYLDSSMIRADREVRRQLTSLKNEMDAFWCAPVTKGDDARSMEDMQAILDSNPAKAAVLLSSHAAAVAFHMEQDPDLVLEIFKPRHLTEGAYVWGEGLTLVSLRPEWEAQEEQE